MATTNKVKKVIYSSLFGLGLTAGGVTLASAATTQEKPPTTVEAPAASADKEATDSTESEKNDVDEKPNYTSSVTVPVSARVNCPSSAMAMVIPVAAPDAVTAMTPWPWSSAFAITTSQISSSTSLLA